MTAYSPEHNRTHVERAQAKLIGVLRKPRLQAIVRSEAEEDQRIEDLAHEVAHQLNIDSDYDWILDAIGRLVGRGRGGLGNDEYRIGLRTQIRINRSHGRSLDLAEVQRLTKPGTWTTVEYPPASLTTYLEAPITLDETEPIASNLAQQKGLGVRLDCLAHYSGLRPGRFAYVSDPQGVGLGYVSDPSVGGLAAHAKVLG